MNFWSERASERARGRLGGSSGETVCDCLRLNVLMHECMHMRMYHTAYAERMRRKTIEQMVCCLSGVCMIYASTSILSSFPWNSFELIRCALDLEKIVITHPRFRFHTIKQTIHMPRSVWSHAHLCIVRYFIAWSHRVLATRFVESMWDFHFHVEKTENLFQTICPCGHILSCVPFVRGGSNGLWSACFFSSPAFLLHITHWRTDFFVFFATFGSS